LEKNQKRIRVLLAKVGLDGHDRGIKVVAQALRDAGMEVIYTGLHQTPQQVVHTALQETVDILGLSFLSGAQMTLVPEIMKLLEEAKIKDEVKVIVGGFLPEDDEIDHFKKIGVKAIFDVDSRLDDIVDSLRTIAGGGGKGEGDLDADLHKNI
jgi:methylmalonyl-CoA mutase cobalamin-binding domain/chain